MYICMICVTDLRNLNIVKYVLCSILYYKVLLKNKNLMIVIRGFYTLTTHCQDGMW